MAVALLDRADGFFPVEPRFNRVALDIIAARETQEFRVQIHQHLHQVLAQAVRTVVPRRREK